MQLIDSSISLATLTKMAVDSFGDLVKAVVDIEKEIMVVDASLHADEEKELLLKGSRQENLWGINLYPELYESEDFIEFDSMINVRPNQHNLSRSVDDKRIQSKIRDIVSRLVRQ